jgi:hypothetical protein
MATSLTLQSLAAPKHSMVCRVSGGAVESTAPRGFWCAYYGAQIVANGWEPFDQPTPASYMPCRYTAFEVTRLDGGGVLLVERHPRPSRAVLRRSHPGLITTFSEALSISAVVSVLESSLVSFGVSQANRAPFLGLVAERADALLGVVAAA